jgi:hypothetical protein
MKREKSFIIAGVISIIGLLSFGCDFSNKEEIPPEELPPVPEACAPLSSEYAHAIRLAQSSVEVSQLQITRIASHFAQCMEEAGLSEEEARGIVRDIEKKTRRKGEKGGSQEWDTFR